MHKIFPLVRRILVSTPLLFATCLDAAPTTFHVTINQPTNGTISVRPPIPADGKVPAGTVLTVKISPAPGYAIDSGYSTVHGPWTPAYQEFFTPKFHVTVDQNRNIGASFIEKNALKGFRVTREVVYAQPGVKKLKYDVYSSDHAKNLPCIIIIHGGGFIFNTQGIMRGLARELVRDGRYVVFSIDYRWFGRRDGDTVSNTLPDIVGDVFGAIAHIQQHAKKYGGDPTRIGLTGDSAGGYLSAAAIDMVNQIGDGGFGVKPANPSNSRQARSSSNAGTASPSPPRSGGLEPLGKRRKEFAEGEGPQRAERAGASESLGRGEVELRAQGEEPIYQFKPTYLPRGKSIEQVRQEMTQAIKAAIPTYGAFSAERLATSDAGTNQPLVLLKALAPVEHIPNIRERAVPQLLLRGKLDTDISNTEVQRYADALKAAGQTVEYIQVEGAGHAFLDWKPDAQTKATFAKYGVPSIARMKSFFDSIFYPNTVH